MVDAFSEYRINMISRLSCLRSNRAIDFSRTIKISFHPYLFRCSTLFFRKKKKKNFVQKLEMKLDFWINVETRTRPKLCEKFETRNSEKSKMLFFFSFLIFYFLIHYLYFVQEFQFFEFLEFFER